MTPNANKILVIDDDLDLLMLLEKKLISEGFEVETASSVPEAVEIIPFWQPQLILLDVDINGEDGRKICGDLKEHPELKEIRVIIMSGYDRSIGTAVWFGADDLMEKPLVMEDLLLRIRFQLGKHTLGEKAEGLN